MKLGGWVCTIVWVVIEGGGIEIEVVVSVTK
jgi:hypothetical protein